MTVKKEVTPKIYAALNSILSEIGSITKDKRNKQQGFQYRGIDQVYDTVHPLLATFKVIVLPEVISMEHFDRVTANGKPMQATKVIVRYTFVAEDGSSVALTMAGEGMDMADKSTAKAMAVAQKYAFFQMFCIPVSDAIDGDAETPEPTTPALRELSPIEIGYLTKASNIGSEAFRIAWKEALVMGNFMASVDQIAIWKKNADTADKPAGEKS